MAQSAQQPPQPRRDHAALSVVSDDLLSRIDARSAQLLHQHLRIGKRVPAVLSGFRRGEIVVEMQEACARDMRRCVFGTPAAGIGQVVTAIEYYPIRIGEVLREDFGADERGENHAAILLAAAPKNL